jgi:hypothetical protein
MRRLAACVAGSIPLLMVTAQVARAQPLAPPVAQAETTRIELIVVGGGREAIALLDTMQDLLGRSGVAVEAHAVATPADASNIPRGSAAARVQVDLRSADEAILVTEGRRQARRQRVIHRDPAPVLAREELAQAIQSAVESQLFGDPDVSGAPSAEPAPVPAPAPTAPASSVAAAPPPAPAIAAPSVNPAQPSAEVEAALPGEAPVAGRSMPLGIDISTLAGGGGFASSVGPVTSLEGDVAVTYRSGWRPFVSLSGRAVLPFDSSAEAVNCRASLLAARVLAGVELVRTSWFALDAGGGGGADVLWTQPSSTVLAASVLGPDATRGDPVVTAFVSAHVGLVPGVALTLLALGDLDLSPSRYVVAQGTSVDPALSPWRVRPTLLAGFTFTAVGPPIFSRGGPP